MIGKNFIQLIFVSEANDLSTVPVCLTNKSALIDMKSGSSRLM